MKAGGLAVMFANNDGKLSESMIMDQERGHFPPSQKGNDLLVADFDEGRQKKQVLPSDVLDI